MRKRVSLALGILLPAWAIAQVGGNGPRSISIRGHIGERIQTCVERRVKAQDTDELVEPFRHLTEGTRWQTEFLGKWMLGACASYEYTRDKELLRKIEETARAFIATQRPDGYIGNYKPDSRLKAWDVWGRKYTTLALLAYHRLTGDPDALRAARGVIDHLIRELDESHTDIAATGFYLGMASCSILEPIVYLYKQTGEERYLAFARRVARSIEGEGRARPVAQALAGVPVSRRSPHPKEWWSYDNGQKAYEMMSCYEGLTELGEITGDPTYLRAATRTAESILADEINIAGSGAAFECWYGGKERQTLPAYHTMETCVTFTWMQFCARLSEKTGDPTYMDAFERAMYNALLASMRRDGSQISKYSPLEGRREPGEEQCGMRINCCNANGPRAFALIPKVAYRTEDDRIYVNLFLDASATLATGKGEVKIESRTRYPLDGRVELSIDPSHEGSLELAIRLPGWSERPRAWVNGEPVEIPHAGGYLRIERSWRKGDRVEIDLGTRTRLVERDGFQAITHGPLVFARDSRFADGDVDECAAIATDPEGNVDATLNETGEGSFAWITLELPARLGTDLENAANKEPRPIRMCDFGSAGNDWDPAGRYRVWLPRVLNVMREEYHPY